MLRKLMLTGATAALLAGIGPASAQIPMGLHLGRDGPPPTQEEIDRQKALDKAYNAATQKIPDKKPAASDPWGNVRPDSSASKNKQTTTAKNKQQ